MNQLSEKREHKLLHLIKGFPDGVTDSQVSDKLKWNTVAVRSVASALKNRGKLTIKVMDKENWIFFPDDDIMMENNGEDKLKETANNFGRSLAELIYVIFSNRK